MLNLATEIERWIDLQAGLGGVPSTRRKPYDARVNDLVLQEFPDCSPHPDLVTLSHYWDRLPEAVLPGIDLVVDLLSGTAETYEFSRFVRNDYRKFVDDLPPDEQAPAAMMPQAMVQVFFTSSQWYVFMETVGPAAGALCYHYLGHVGWVARSLAEFFDRACFLVEESCCELMGGSLGSHPDRVDEMVRRHVPLDGSVDLAGLTGFAQQCLVDVRDVGPGFSNRRDWLRWRWEDPAAPTA